MDDIEARVLKVAEELTDAAALSFDAKTLAARLGEDLGLDSLDAIELVMAIEEEFAIEIADQDAKACETLADVVKLVGDELADRAADAAERRAYREGS